MSNPLVYRKHRRRAFKKQGGLCFWCGCEMLRFNETGSQQNQRLCTAEHLLPASTGGADSAYNIVAACTACNTARKDLPLEIWRARVGFRLKQAGNPQHYAVILQWLATYGINLKSATPPSGPDGNSQPQTVPPLKDTLPAP